MKTPGRPARGRDSAAVFLGFLGLYLLVAGRFPPNGDAVPLWEVAVNILRDHSVAVQNGWNLATGRDGLFYCPLPLLDSLVHLPGAALLLLVERIDPAAGPLVLPLAARLGSAALGALTCVVFLGLARRFVGRAAALVTTLFVGLGTLVGYYARMPYTEIVQALCFTGFMAATVDALDALTPRAARRLGLWLGLLVNAKLVFVLSAPGVALVLFWRHRREPRALAAAAAWAALPLALLAVPILGYNWLRFGAVTATGYGAVRQGTLWRGLWGLLFSPGKSVFLYDPPLLLALFGLPALIRDRGPFASALAAAVLPIFLLYAGFMYWDGDWAWGPRYLVPFLPALCVPLALLVERALAAGRRRLRALGLGLALTASLGMQALGSLFFWDHWISIALTASASWLQHPGCVRYPPEGGCWPDGKILYGMHWLPAFNPVAGHLWLLRHKPAGDPFDVAEADAPWQWEGHIHAPDAAVHYDAVIFDWWPLAWEGHRSAAAAVAAPMVACVLAGVALGRRRRRRTR